MVKFVDWLNNEFFKWQSGFGRRKTVSEFADYIGVSQSLMSHYLGGTRTPSGENVDKIADALGDEIYAILELQPPDPKFRIIKRLWDLLSEEERAKLTEQAENYAAHKAPKTS